MEDQPEAPPTPQPPAAPWFVRCRFFILIGLTVVGAVMRFATLDRPPLWGDEALTYSRVFGTFDQMMRILRNDGFTPLNYLIYWWMQHEMPVGPFRLAPGLVLTPSIMRVVPALCGTLMIPAMYFVTRRLASVRASLLAAALACMSAYLMAYSHDAKMYIQCWLFVTLNLGCFLWWLRTDRWVAWIGWIFCGVIAMGFHIAAVLLMAPQLIIMLTHARVQPRHLILFSAGLLLLAAAPYGYYKYANQWMGQTGGLLAGNPRSPDAWNNSGVAWVDEYNRGIPGAMLIREAASAYLIGTEWTDTPRARHVVSARVSAIVGSAFLANLALISLGVLPWRRAWTKPPPTPDPDPPAETGWRVLLWLGLLLVIPVYGFFYCRSVHDFAPPQFTVWQLVAAMLILPILVYFSGHDNRERSVKLVQFTIVAAVLLGVTVSIALFWKHQYTRHWESMRSLYGPHVSAQNSPELDWKSLWMPRYLGFVWPVIGIAVCILIMRLPTRWLRWSAIALLLSVNAVNSMFRLFADTQPPHPRVFADLLGARESAGEMRVVLSSVDPDLRGAVLWLRASNFGLYGDAGRYYACMTLGLKTTPDEFRSGQVADQYHDIAGEVVTPRQIPRIISSSAKRLVVWERYATSFAEPEQIPADDEIVQALAPRWKLAREPEIFRQRSWNEWGDVGWYRRREFVPKP